MFSNKLQAILMTGLLLVAFIAGGLFTTPGYAATQFDGTPGAGTTTTLTVTESGWYSVTLKGAAGADGANYNGGSGGFIKALVYLDKAKTNTIVTYEGGSAGGGYSNYFAGRGGAAIALLVDGEPVLGAAGGGGGNGVRQYGSDNSLGKPVTTTVTSVASGFSSGGGGGCYYYRSGSWENTQGQPGHGGAAAGRSTMGGDAGKNFILESQAMMVHMNNGNLDKNTSYSVSLINNVPNLPTTKDFNVTGNDHMIYKSPTKMIYTVSIQANGGDIMQGEIVCNKNDILEISVIGNAMVFRHNYNNVGLLAASPGGAQAGSLPSCLSWNGGDSYANGLIMQNVSRDSATKPAFVFYKITAKECLEETITSIPTGTYPSFEYGTVKADIIQTLPTSVTVLTNKGSAIVFPIINWDCAGFKSTPGTFIFEAAIDTSGMSWILNPSNLKAVATIHINDISNASLRESITEDILALSVPTINVVKGKPFDLILAVYPKIDAGTYGTIVIENPSKEDNLIRIRGTLAESGYRAIVMNGYDFIFNVVEEPTESSITTIFN